MDALVVAVSCSPQLTVLAAVGSAVMFDTEAQGDTLEVLEVLEQAPWCWAQTSVALSSGEDFDLVSMTAFCRGACFWV